MPTLVRKTLGEYRRALIGWTVGLCAFLGMYISIYASMMRQDPETFAAQAIAKYPGALRDLMGGMSDIATGRGYLQAIAYQLLGPLLFTMCAAILGNRAIAGPEEAKTLELTLTLPIDRRRLLLERWAALALGLLAVTLVTLALVAGASSAAHMEVPFGGILAAHTGLFLLVLFFGTLTLCVGAAFGRKQVALAVVGVWGVAGYIVETMGRSIDAISWLRWLSPVHYYLDGRPLYQGWPYGDYLVLLGATAVLLMTALLAFERRDVGV
ncbi:ABC transporter permease subunit [Microbispora bryophytorum]|uniref:ABC transporter permease subunit n=1 Tax=Microbispora bryophytorum subsp. camponoti TaxID=1677852 RepID=A0ABR8L0L8_9ACTN|nr:ABC transporter permease subunit [Microbispora camponoti]MBD3142028.1 ABC transporter permease subunit [Microbispora camponoti]